MKLVVIYEFRGALYVPNEYFTSDEAIFRVRILSVRPLVHCRKLIKRGGDYQTNRYFHYSAKDARKYGEIAGVLREPEQFETIRFPILELKKKISRVVEDDCLVSSQHPALSASDGECD